MVYYKQCLEKQREIDELKEKVGSLQAKLRYQERTAQEEFFGSSTCQMALQAFALFVQTFEAKYPKAVECLIKDREVLLTLYDFPAEHWIHLRTTNPSESTFATVRLGTVRIKGCGSRTACLTMVFKLAQIAEKHLGRLNGQELIPEVIRGVSSSLSAGEGRTARPAAFSTNAIAPRLLSCASKTKASLRTLMRMADHQHRMKDG